MYEAPESDIVKVRIDENVILGKGNVEYIRVLNKNSQANENPEAEMGKNGEDNGEQQSQAKTYA